MKAVAGTLHVSQSLVYAWGDAAEEHRNDPLTQLIKIMLRGLEQGEEGALEPLNLLIEIFLAPGEASGLADLERRLLEINRECGELDGTHLEATVDGALTVEERDRLRREASDIAAKVESYLAALDRVVPGDPS